MSGTGGASASAGDLLAAEAALGVALRTGDRSGITLLGLGEVSTVLGWPPDAPVLVCKRLPPMRSVDEFRAYAEVVDRYMSELTAAGVRVVPTELRCVRRPDGAVIGFHVQPVLPAGSIGVEVLRRARPQHSHPMVAAIIEAVAGATSEQLGIDAQLANWAWLDGHAHQLDLTTPFLLGPDRRPAFDLAPFLAALPAIARPVVRREIEALILRWMTARGALTDLAANVIKEHLDPWLPVVLAEVNRRVSPPVTVEEAARVHAKDRRLWPLLLRLEKGNRWWQQRVRRRPYEFLLPDRTTYADGPSWPAATRC